MMRGMIALLMLTPIFLTYIISPVAFADPRPSYYVLTMYPNTGVIEYKGSYTTVEISFWINIPLKYGGATGVSYTQTLEMKSQASIGIATAIGVAYGAYSGSILGIGGNGGYIIKSYDGYMCDHTMVVTSLYNPGFSYEPLPDGNGYFVNKTIQQSFQ